MICDMARDRSYLVAHHSCRLWYVTVRYGVVHGVEKAKKEEEEGKRLRKGRRKGNMTLEGE